MKSRKYILTTALLSVLAMAGYLLPGFAHATTTIYTLSNHPDSGGDPNPGDVSFFGLRLDGLLTGDASETYIFDFDHASSNMLLTIDDMANTIEISGTAFGYENNNLDGSIVAGTEALWSINFVYDMNITGTYPDDLSVGAPGHVNFGEISSSLGSFDLRDHYSDTHLSAFLFADDITEFSPVLTGWGWLDYCNTATGECVSPDWRGSDQNIADLPLPYTADWLFEATLVPVPAAVWLFGSGLIGLIAVARRKK